MTRNGSEKILMITTHGYVAAQPELGQPDTGGQVVYVLELSRCLARMGFEVDVLTRQFAGQALSEAVDDRVQIFRFPCGNKDFIPKEVLWESMPEWVDHVTEWMIAQRRSYRLINSHYWDAGVAGQLLADRFRCPHVHTPHSIGAWKRNCMSGDPQEMERRYNFRTRVAHERRIYTECDLLVATTTAQRKVMMASEYGAPAEKIEVIPPGYDDRRFFPVSTTTRRLLARELGFQGKVILALGRLAHNKGFDLLLRALPTICERVADALLVLAAGSTNPSAAELEQLQSLRDLAAQLGIADRVHFKGYIGDDELADYYRAADVFALCSRYEPFGMTAIEAMACGTPTVITTEGGLRDYVDWGIDSLYANPYDPQAFAHALTTVLQNSVVAERLARFGPPKVRGRFTWTNVAQQLITALDREASPTASPLAVLAAVEHRGFQWGV